MTAFTHFHWMTLKIRFLCMRTFANELQRDSCGCGVATAMRVSRFYDARQSAVFREFSSHGKESRDIKRYEENVKILQKMRNLIKNYKEFSFK